MKLYYYLASVSSACNGATGSVCRSICADYEVAFGEQVPSFKGIVFSCERLHF